MRRPALLRSAVITAALGGAVLVPTAAFADAHAPAHAQEPAHAAIHATVSTAAETGAEPVPQERPATRAASDDISANPYFLVAGGAMAAAGAAGLVYSTVRRGRADG
ncbi:hypothetical protein OKJ48_03900 [Streptomyces kunmingensis]|uniref:Uncharacterized protein n=1 Tax=Streptomyces kunmingensis TaxID=68225 RepID=A0ABU6C454_9ACTN|nr:hypothetical protein [Streptomyces kunmingensis]MEB3959397.1 hypothetical protein [Streptomyces kunmingensis]